MRNYTAKIKLDETNDAVGTIGETVFSEWFNNNFQDEFIHKQLSDRDFEGIDFACNKGYTYQIKTTTGNTYTFNSALENLPNKLPCDFYVFIQIREGYAYIEGIYTKDYVLDKAQRSYHYENSFVWAKDLKIKKVDINQIKLF
jgi:hypothetical protein